MALSKRERWDLQQKGKSKWVPHSFKGKICNYTYCVQCGLILLNNVVTKKAANKLCDIGED